jgi:putative ABC transport system permease protein
MFRMNVKFAIRNLSKYKTFSFINLTGLIIGITASLLILMYVINELSFEDIHQNRDRIYRVNTIFGNGASEMKLAGANTAMAPAAESNIPSVEKATRLLPVENIEVTYGNKHFNEIGFSFTDTSFFKIFTTKIIKGNHTNPLSDPYSVVITETVAKKIFGSENPISKTLKCGNNDLLVRAVVQDVPINTQMQWKYLASFALYEKMNPSSINWASFGSCYTYLMLKKNASDASLGKDLNNLLIQNAGQAMANLIKVYPQKLTDIYLHAETMGEPGLKGNITYVYLFSSVAVLILVIACFNFMNLSTARSLNRAREVGIKKVLGANRLSLAKQFLSESLLLTSVAVIISVILYEILNPFLSDFLGYTIAVKSIYNIYFYLVIIGITLITGLFSGIYPALVLSKFRPIETLKGITKPGSAGSFARKVLVVFQFAISIFLFVSTFSIFKQLNYMRTADLGFDKSNLLLINFPASSNGSAAKYKLLKDGLMLNPNIKNVSGIYTLPGLDNKEMQTVKMTKDDQSNNVMRTIGVDYDFVKTLGMHLVSGRSFSEAYSTDEQSSVILNESAVKSLGIKNPLGTSLFIPGENNQSREIKVIGIVKDFNISSLKDQIDPVFLYINPERFFTVAVKLSADQTRQTISYIQNEWNKIFPERKIDYSFMDQKYSQLYSPEEKLAELFSIFSVLAIFVACLGLFGLSAFTVEVKTKEIGVRKVLGASISGISFMLSKQFVVWVLIANIFALPVAGYAVNKWLQNFAFRISLDWTTFVISSLLVLAVALLAISMQIIKAAFANPVESLRYE